MKRFFCCGFVAAMALVYAGSAQAQDEPDFALSFGGCGDDVVGPSSGGGAYSDDVNLMLATSNNPSAEDGAQGWSISLSSEGVSIDAITIEGTDAGGLTMGGFEKTETTDARPDAAGGCVDLAGAVSAVVLSFTMPITLPADGMNSIARISVSGEFPPAPGGEEPNSAAASVFFVDGCRGSGQPVDNNVTWMGNTIKPALGRCVFNLVTPPVPPVCPKPEGTGGLWTTFQAASSVQVVGEVNAGSISGPVEGPGEYVVEGAAGATGAVSVFPAIVSELSGEVGGVQGWSLSIGVTGDLNLLAATLAGTAGAAVPDGLANGGFEKTETVEATKNDQGQGAVSAVVLSFTMPIQLAPVGTATVLRMDLESAAPIPDDGSAVGGQVAFADGLQGSGQPVANVATVNGNTVQFECAQALNVRFVKASVVERTFLRCDPNNDGENNLADAIWIVNELFRGGPPTACPASADCNADEQVDSSDALYAVTYQFLGGAPPPPPFPDCGTDGPFEPGTVLACEPGTSTCN